MDQKRLAELVAKANERMMMAAFGIGQEAAPSADSTLTHEKFTKMMGEWGKIRQQHRRSSMTVQVSAGHIGPVLMHSHPTDGTTVEASHQQAQAIHRECPLVLLEVVDTEKARFRTAHQFDGIVPSVLPAPPYEISPDIEAEYERIFGVAKPDTKPDPV